MLSTWCIADNDYITGPYDVSFTAGQQSATLILPTVDDSTTELSEYFMVAITSTDQPSVVEIGSPSTSLISIEDNDPGKCIAVIFTYKYTQLGIDVCKYT